MDINDIAEKLKKKSFKKENIPMPKDSLPFELRAHLCVEIGCGAGMHPILFGKKYPEKQLVAIEHTQTRFQKFQQRLKNHPQLLNIIPKHENAISWITHKLPPMSVDEFYLLYPNPFPKPKDYNKRWVCMPFFGQLIQTLKSGGTITIATNEKFYFEEAKAVNELVWGLEIVEQRQIYQSEVARTHFEKKYLSREESCYNLIFKKS